MVAWRVSPQILRAFSSWHTILTNKNAAVLCSQSLHLLPCHRSSWFALGHGWSLFFPQGPSLPTHLSRSLLKSTECLRKPKCANFTFFINVVYQLEVLARNVLQMDSWWKKQDFVCSRAGQMMVQIIPSAKATGCHLAWEQSKLQASAFQV